MFKNISVKKISVLRRSYLDILEMLPARDPNDILLNEGLDILEGNIQWCEDYINEQKLHTQSYRYFITISFDDGKLDLLNLPNYIISKLDKKWITDYVFSIEQRSVDIHKYHGYHTHIYITASDSKRSPAQIKREFYSSFKSLVDNERFIDVKRIIKDNGIEAYLNGLKNQEKIPKVINDNNMRKQNFYELIYRKTT